MLFSDPTFLCFFLPLVLLAYFGLGARAHNLVLLVFSLGFYAWGERKYVAVLMLSIVLNWACGMLAARGGSAGRLGLAGAIVGNLGLLVGFKYTNFLVDNLNVALAAVLGRTLTLAPIHLPIGISFFAFQGMSYVIDVHRGTVPPQRSLLKLGMYKAFFPQLIAGPIVRYVDIKSQVDRRVVTLDDFGVGVRRFVIGLAKKMIIANALARPADEILALPQSQHDFVLAWTAMLAYGLQIYFDFSGYSDMAIGLGRMFGFRFLENFDYPYAATSVGEFWRRWHISLSSWFRDYLYIPLGGNRVAPWRRSLNLLTVFLLCGLWHGASWSFAVWGLWHGGLLMIERVPWLKPLGHAPRVVRHAYVLLAVTVGWVFFRADNLTAGLHLLEKMFALGPAPIDAPNVRLFIDSEVAFAAFVGVLASGPFLGRLFGAPEARAPEPSGPTRVFELCGLVAAFAYSLMLMAAGSYSPFIYFRF